MCQTDQKDPTTNYGKNKPVTEINLKENDLRLQSELWRKKIDRPKNITAALSILDGLFGDNETPKLVWHRNCRPNFMSRAKLDRYVDDTETIDVESDNNMLDNSASNSSMYLRNQAATYLKDSNCIVCHRMVEWYI